MGWWRQETKLLVEGCHDNLFWLMEVQGGTRVGGSRVRGVKSGIRAPLGSEKKTAGSQDTSCLAKQGDVVRDLRMRFQVVNMESYTATDSTRTDNPVILACTTSIEASAMRRCSRTSPISK